MALSIENSNKKSYFIKSRTTKKGNMTYYLTTKEDESCLDEIPKGYEVFEKYDYGSLFIRKKIESLFTQVEIDKLRKHLDKNKSIYDYRINIHGKEIAIYTAESIRFEERMRIKVFEDGSERNFEVERFCYRGSVDDWITIGSESDIDKIGSKYLIHLGKESYYELNWVI